MKDNTRNILIEKLKDVTFMGNLYVLAGIFIGSFFSYLLQIFLALNLSVAEYGTFNALLALSVILSIPITAFASALTKLVSELKAQDDFPTLTYLFINFTVGAIVIGIVLFGIITFSSKYISTFLNIEYDVYLFVNFGLFIALSFLAITPSSYLQGLLRFKAFSFFSVLGGLIRFGLPALFVLAGFSIGGVFFGIGISFLFLFIIAVALLAKNFESFKRSSLKTYYRRVFDLSVITLFLGLGMNFLNNIDTLMVKHYFSAHDAGLYASAVTIGKLFLFGAGTVTILMYPQISELHAKGANIKDKFYVFLTMQVALVLCGFLIFWFIPELITRVMFGEAFREAVEIVPKMAVTTAGYVMLNFIYMTLIAINKGKVVFMLIPGIILQGTLLTYYHETLSQVILVNNAVVFGLLIIALGYLWDTKDFVESPRLY